VNADGEAETAPGVPIAPDEAVPMETAGRISKLNNESLYPEYARSLDVFHCPNNVGSGSDTPRVAGAAGVVTVQRRDLQRGSGTLAAEPRNFLFYKFDSYSANRRVDPATGKLVATSEPNAYVARYRTIWTDVYAPNTPEFRTAEYRNQLVWQNPSDETLVTACSYHADRGALILLWLNGSAKVLDLRKFDKPEYRATDPSTDYDLFKYGPTD
jgi:hypothetical protein